MSIIGKNLVYKLFEFFNIIEINDVQELYIDFINYYVYNQTK